MCTLRSPLSCHSSENAQLWPRPLPVRIKPSWQDNEWNFVFLSLTMVQIGSTTAVPIPNQKIHCNFLLKVLGYLNKKKMTPIPGMVEPECAALIGCFSAETEQPILVACDGERT